MENSNIVVITEWFPVIPAIALLLLIQSVIETSAFYQRCNVLFRELLKKHVSVP